MGTLTPYASSYGESRQSESKRNKAAHSFHFSMFSGLLVNEHACPGSFGWIHSRCGNPGCVHASLSARTILWHRSQHLAFSSVNVGYAEFALTPPPTGKLHAGKQHVPPGSVRRLLVFGGSSSSSDTTTASSADSMRALRVRRRGGMPARREVRRAPTHAACHAFTSRRVKFHADARSTQRRVYRDQ